MQAFGAVLRDAKQVAQLHSCGFVARDDVGLHHHAHVFLQDEGRFRNAAFGFACADRWRQEADAKAVQKTVVDGEAALGDNVSGIKNVFAAVAGF